MPGEEDFGIAAVEAMSTGCPVIAFAAGGALETVRDSGQNVANPTGLLYKRPEVDCLAQAMMELEGLTGRFDPVTMHGLARRFSPSQFSEGFKQIVGPLLRQRDWTSPW
jgi:glycosyltransferase involved in cell wall biosynthesis